MDNLADFVVDSIKNSPERDLWERMEERRERIGLQKDHSTGEIDYLGTLEDMLPDVKRIVEFLGCEKYAEAKGICDRISPIITYIYGVVNFCGKPLHDDARTLLGIYEDVRTNCYYVFDEKTPSIEKSIEAAKEALNRLPERYR